MSAVSGSPSSVEVRIVEETNLDSKKAREFAEHVAQADGVEPFGEAFIRGFEDRTFEHRHFLALDARGQWAGLAAVADDAIELAVAPACRRQGIGTALVSTIDAAMEKKLPVWAHGNIAGAGELASATSRELVRQLLQMQVEGPVLHSIAAAVDKRAGFELINLEQAWDRFGRSEVDQAWLRVNNEAFDWHPEQGGWTVEQLRRARDTSWFDPRGVLFLVATAKGASSAEDIVGFHWTKWHAEEEVPTGEVYVIGLARRAMGRGLGHWLTAAGVQYLIGCGAQRVLLYVEGDNAPAVKTYERLGFEISRQDVMYGIQTDMDKEPTGGK